MPGILSPFGVKPMPEGVTAIPSVVTTTSPVSSTAEPPSSSLRSSLRPWAAAGALPVAELDREVAAATRSSTPRSRSEVHSG